MKTFCSTFSFSIACQESWLKTCSLFWYKYFDRTLTGLQDHERRMSEWEEPQVDEKEKREGRIEVKSSFALLSSWCLLDVLKYRQHFRVTATRKMFPQNQGIPYQYTSLFFLLNRKEEGEYEWQVLSEIKPVSLSVRRSFAAWRKNTDNFNNLRVTVSPKEKWVRTWNFMRNFRDYDLCDTVLSETGDKKCKGYKEKEAWRMSYTFFSLHV